jgi:hypothetical protein
LMASLIVLIFGPGKVSVDALLAERLGPTAERAFEGRPRVAVQN